MINIINCVQHQNDFRLLIVGHSSVSIGAYLPNLPCRSSSGVLYPPNPDACCSRYLP